MDIILGMYSKSGQNGTWGQNGIPGVLKKACLARVYFHVHLEGIRQHDSSDTGHSDNVKIAAEHREPAEVLSQLDNTSNSPVYGEYKCC